jgi:hypothetical protein
LRFSRNRVPIASVYIGYPRRETRQVITCLYKRAIADVEGERTGNLMSGFPGGLNLSTQHLHEVYSQESESLKFF